MVKGEL